MLCTAEKAILTLILTILANGISAQSVDYYSTGEMLQRNRADILRIDVFLTNLDMDSTPAFALRSELEPVFKEAIRRDFFANMFYLRGQYGPAMDQLVKSRQELTGIYRRTVEYYMDTAGVLLDEPAVRIVRTEDSHAKHYLQLGFRHLARAQTLTIRATATDHTIAGEQINLYTEAFHEMRMARKYAILATMHSVTPRSEKESLRFISYDEYKQAGQDFKIVAEKSIYEKQKVLLESLLGKKRISVEIQSKSRGYLIILDLLRVHDENFERIHTDRTSLYVDIATGFDGADFQKLIVLPKRNSMNRNEIPAENSDPLE